MNDYFEVKLGRLIEAVNKNGTLEVDLDNRKLSLKKSINDDKLKDILPKLVSSDISNGTPQDISQACDSPAKMISIPNLNLNKLTSNFLKY